MVYYIDMESFSTRGIEKILPSKEELDKALSERTLSIYYGIDPTGADMHLGHLSNLLVLKRFIQMGHKVTILFGGFTARIGDPSGKEKSRKPLTKKEVEENLKTYKDQIKKVFKGDFKKINFKNNNDWLERLKFEDVLKLASMVTVQQMIERDMFQRRIKEENPIGLHEFMYPLMQGYDSYALMTDVEVGGNDQLFNMMMGRTIESSLTNGEKEKLVVTLKLLVDPETGKKMSKSEGFYASLNAEPNDLFGQIMRVPDGAIMDCFELCTEVDLSIINKDENPRDLKMKLAYEIVRMIYDEDKANKAQEEFENVFSGGGLPENIEEYRVSESKNIIDLLVDSGLVESKSEARRLIDGRGVELDGEVVEDWNMAVDVGQEKILKVGKRRFLKLVK